MPREGAITFRDIVGKLDVQLGLDLGSALVGGRRCTGVLGSMGMFTEHCAVGRRPDAIDITVGDMVVIAV